MSEFIDDIKKVREKRTPSCTGTLKVQTIYRILKRDKKVNVDYKTFHQIIRTMGKNLSKMIMDGEIVKLPLQMGHFAVIQEKTFVKFKDGKVYHNHKIDWNSTIRLWESDDEAKRNKQLVYFTTDKLLFIKYYRRLAKFKNKYFFEVRATSAIKRNIHKYADENKIVYHINRIR